MNDIKRVLRKAAWRIFVIDFIRALVIAVCAGLGGLIVLRLVQQFTAIQMPWVEVAAWSAGGAVVVALIWAAITRADRLAVARRVDEGADLRETLSTALWVSNTNDPWARITVEAAAQRARTVDVRRAVPVTAPRFWPVPVAMGLALLVVWLTVGEYDLLGKRAAAEQKKSVIAANFTAETKINEELKKFEDIAAKLDLGKDKDEPSAPDAEKPEVKTPEQLQRDAIKKLTTIKDRLQELKSGEKAQSLEALKEELKKLKSPGEGPLAELSKELAKGNFDKANEELQKLLEKMQSGQMSPEQKAKLAEQLKQMSEQLEKLAEQKKELEKALEKAGLDKKLASNPEALKEALEKAEGLSEEQKKELQKKAQAQSKACEACSSMAGAMSKMGAAAAEGEEGLSEEEMEAAEGLAGQLSELEQMAQEMASLDAKMSECEGSLAALASFGECNNPGMGECEGGLTPGTKPWSSGWNENMGVGRGGPGRSAGGGDPGEEEADTNFEKIKAKTKNQGGPIISSRLVEGEQIKGESVAQYAEATAAAQAQATEAIENNVYPREYHDALKHYFGRLAAKAKAEEVGGGAPPAPAPKAAEKK